MSHVPGRCLSKTLVCFADNTPILAVLPAYLMVDFEALGRLAGASVIRLASEQEFAGLYPECEAGAMPPFGDLYLQRVFVDRTLVGECEMVFNAGTHIDAIRMHYGDFADLTRPTVGSFGRFPAAGSAVVAAGAGV